MISLLFAASFVTLADVEGASGTDFFQLEYEQRVAVQGRPSNRTSSGSEETSAPEYIDYAWTYACVTTYPGPVRAPECGINESCAEPGTVAWRLWSQRPDGTWVGTQGFECFGENADPNTGAAAPAAITAAMVLNEIRRIGLPDPSLRTEPPGTTLVNLETRLITADESFTAEVTLLGRAVSLEATPVQFVVDHGDGTTTTIDPAADSSASDTLTHVYERSGSLSPHITTTWAARYSVDGGPVIDIDETITLTGPPTDLTVVQSVPRLAGS